MTDTSRQEFMGIVFVETAGSPGGLRPRARSFLGHGFRSDRTDFVRALREVGVPMDPMGS